MAAKTTWTLELKAAAAQREARALRRELRSLQGGLEDVDGAAQRASRSLAGIHTPAGLAGIQRRARAERSLTQSVVRSTEAQRLGLARVSEDLTTQQRIRTAVDRAQRANAARAAAADQRRQAESAAGWQVELRHRNRVARADIARERASDRAWRGEMARQGRIARAEITRDRQRRGEMLREESFRARVGNQMLSAYGRQQRQAATARQRAAAQQSSNRMAMLSYGAHAVGGGAAAALAGALSITSMTIGAATTLAEMALSAGSLALNLGESVLQMIAFRESALTTLRAMSGGNAAVASEQYRFAQQFAMRTPLDAQQVLELQSQVSTAGFTGTQNREILQGAADVGASRPNDPAAARRYVLALSQIRNAGRLRAQEMNQLGEVGVGRRDLLLELGRQQNITRGANETEDAYVARLGQMQERGRFSGDAGVAAAQGVVRRNLDNGGELGSFATSQGETLLGTLSNLRGSLFTLLTTIDDIENRPGVRALRTVLNGIAMTLSGVTPTGQRLQGIVASIVDDVGLLVGFSVGDFDGTLNSWLDTATELWPYVRDIIGAFTDGALGEARAQFGGIGGEFRDMLRSAETLQDAREIGRGLVALFGTGVRVTRAVLSVAGAVAELAGGFSALWRDMGSLERFSTVMQLLTNPFSTIAGLGMQSAVRGQMESLGASSVDGIRAGIAAQRGLLDADVAAMAQSIPTTTADALAIRSPSRVMADAVGQHIPTGIAEGIDAGRGPLDRAMQSLVPIPGAGGFGALGGGLGGASFQFNVALPPGTSAEMAEELANFTFEKLVRMLEPAALAGG